MINTINSLSTKELSQLIDKKEVCIIDSRPVDAYNGWKIQNEKRGGHIKGARCLPVKWTKYIDWIEIVRSKGILPKHKIVVYGYSEEDINVVAERFQKSGYKDVSTYYDFQNEWSSNENLPIEKLARYRQLVSAKWLKNLIEGGSPDEYENNKFVVCHSHYRNPNDYDLDHIPGAISVDTNELESPETWNRRSPSELKNVLESKGISADTTVIMYGRFSFPDNDDPFPGSSAGHLGAIRFHKDY